MYKLVKWAYELGQRNALEKLHADLYLYIGPEPIRYSDTKLEMRESEASYKRRVDAWFAANELLKGFFSNTNRDEL